MKLYTTFTPSHKIFYEKYFLPTLPNGFELKVFENNEQLCLSGSYQSEGWFNTTRKKLEIFVQACEENLNKHFFYCDVDVQFFDSSLQDQLLIELGNHDIACQNDIFCYNTGVFICLSSYKMLNLFRMILKNFTYTCDDQQQFNKYIHLCNCKLLSKRFFTTGYQCGVWNYQDFNVPKDIILHHANWVVGIDNKIRVLDIVRDKFYAR